MFRFNCNFEKSFRSVCVFPVDDVLERMMDDRTAADSKLLTGHSGPVYAARFSRDRKYLVSCSEDGTGMLRFVYKFLVFSFITYQLTKI